MRGQLTTIAMMLAGVVQLHAAEPVDYLKDVKPILTARCVACHVALQQKAGMRADTAKSLIDHGVVLPGKGNASSLIAHVSGTEGFAKMPPQAEGEALSAQQIKTLVAWIDAGAKSPANEQADPDPREHWAFRAPKRPIVPGKKSDNPIDAFLASGWSQQGLTPQPAADKQLLLRRLTIDLTGLPPTADESAAFLKDTSPKAYETVVERLLKSPAYGERWGRHFLDIWRYSDPWGLGAEVRNSQKHIWHWRDWTVESLNADKGYDQMIREMLAADELYPNDTDKLRASGFLVRQYFRFNRTTWLDETIEHTGKAFLGLTFNCAKCHDHKFDPISANDYYSMRAFFEPYQVRTDLVPGELDVAKAGLPRAYDCNADAPTYKHERGDERKPLTNTKIAPGIPTLLAFGEFKITPVKLPLEAAVPHLRPHVEATYRQAIEARIVTAKDLVAKAERETALAAIVGVRKLHPVSFSVARLSYGAEVAELSSLKARFAAERAKNTSSDNAASLAKEAAEQEKQALLARAEVTLAMADTPAKQDAATKALALAKKATENPGVTYTIPMGAVKTAESNVEPESNRLKPFPTTSTGRRTALANWIADARNPLTARVVVNQIWARHLGSPLVPTVFDFGRKGTRPIHPELLDWLAVEFTENGWSMKHLHRLIVTSQAYRMSSSNVNAEANRKIDPENKYLCRQNAVRMEAQVIRDSLLHLAGTLDTTRGGPPVSLSEPDTSKRRSLYFVHSHNDHHKFLMQFDDANVLDCYRRTESVVPQQALTLANSAFAITMADAISKRITAKSDMDYINAAFELVLSSKPTTEEVTVCQEAMAEWQKKNGAAKARMNLIAALLNHNDFVTVR